MKKSLILVFFLILISVYAHQPRIGFEPGTLENPINVDKPEISKAYYMELNGASHFYNVSSDKTFNLYLNILSPDIPNARKDFIVDILKDENLIFSLNESNWGKFYEPFGGDNYLQGPEFDKQVEAGTYIIKVYNKDNLGKYSLAIGKLESFPLNEILKTIVNLPKIKTFFNKSPFSAYFNLSGLFLLILLIIIFIFIYVLVKIIKYFRKI